MKTKLIKIISLVMVVTALMSSVAISASAFEEETAIDKLAEFIMTNDDVVEFYLNSDNYTQRSSLTSTTARNYRVYTTDDYDMYLSVVEMYQLYYAAAIEIIDDDYSVDIISSSSFSAYNTSTISTAIKTALTNSGATTTQASMAGAICLGSNSTNYNPTSCVSTNELSDTTAVSYVGSIITTTDMQGYVDYLAETGEDYGRVYTLNLYLSIYSEEIDGVTYYIRYFEEDSISTKVVKSDDDLDEWIVTIDTTYAGTYPVIAIAISSIVTTAYAVDGGNIYFDLDYDTSTATLSDADSTITRATIPATINNFTISQISEYAFYHCEELTSLVVPETIEIIDKSAFRSCTSLTSIKILGDVQTINKFTFAYCSSLQYIIISGEVQEIGYMAFASCTNLKSITLPSTVTSIDETAFYNLSNLETIYFGGSEAQWIALNANIDEDVTVIFNHVCSDTDNDGCCDECEFEIVIEDVADQDTSEDSTLSYFSYIIESIRVAIADIFSIIFNIFNIQF